MTLRFVWVGLLELKNHHDCTAVSSFDHDQHRHHHHTQPAVSHVQLLVDRVTVQSELLELKKFYVE